MASAPDVARLEDEELLENCFSTWRTVVWDDPVNLMDYVVEVFCRHFGYDRPRSRALMLEVHERGHAVVSVGPRERMEADVLAMHDYGLRATLERDE